MLTPFLGGGGISSIRPTTAVSRLFLFQRRQLFCALTTVKANNLEKAITRDYHTSHFSGSRTSSGRLCHASTTSLSWWGLRFHHHHGSESSVGDIMIRRLLPSSSYIGGGNRILTAGSGIGSDHSMIAANDRWRRRSGNNSSGSGGGGLINKLATNVVVPRRGLSTATTTTASNKNPNAGGGGGVSGGGDGGSGGGSGGVSGSGGMEDEYGEMTSEGYTYRHPVPFELESGEILNNVELRYQTYGTLNERKDNVLVICHALTGNASLHSWWGDLLGPGLAFDTSKYFIVCANILGSCYGSTSPSSPKPTTTATTTVQGDDGNNDDDNDDPSDTSSSNSKEGEVYGMSFPDVSVQDTVKLQLYMLKHDLKIHSVKCVIGGSFGGMQAVEYAAQAGKVDSKFSINDETGRAKPFVRTVVPIACGPAHTAWQIAISEVQRQAIYADPKWNNGNPSMSDPPLKGLSVARQIGMVSYRTPIGYEKKFGRILKENVHPPYGSKAPWQVKSYLEYQGHKFLSRFDPITYIKLTEQMDTHDVGRNRGGRKNALASVHIPALVLGIDSDVLYPLHEQKELVDLFPNAKLEVIHSEAGHDGFLLEQDQVAMHIAEFLASHD